MHQSVPPHHAPGCLPGLSIDAYNAELHDDGGFVGDRANSEAFHSILGRWRERLRQTGEDPLGDRATEDVGRRRLEQALLHGDTEAAGLVITAIEEFAEQLVLVCRRLLGLTSWSGTQRIAVGGGFRASRLGELAIGRAGVLLRAERGVEMRPIHHAPDLAGLLGAGRLAPAGMADQHAVLAVDIGGTKIRAGLVAQRGPEPQMLDRSVWLHAADRPSRGEAVERLAMMLRKLGTRAKHDGKALAPFIGIGCPGLIREDGRILRGGQNLPGDWSAPDFNLPEQLAAKLPALGESRTVVLLHNDAVVQGLSEAPWMQDVDRWGILTIGTGLGNARFTKRTAG